MGSIAFKHLAVTFEAMTKAARMVASNAVHLAKLHEESNYPG